MNTNQSSGATENTQEFTPSAEGTEQTTALQKRDVIDEKRINDLDIQINYNGVDCETKEQAVEALREHMRRAIARKGGIGLRDEQTGEPLPNVLLVNGKIARIRLQPVAMDENGLITETLKEYYERTRVKNSNAYLNTFKWLQTIDVLPDLK